MTTMDLREPRQPLATLGLREIRRDAGLVPTT
jgi:hypothetical protein